MIAQFLTSTRCSRILRLLDLERKVILNGPLSSLRTLVDRRERAIADILSVQKELPAEFVATLKAKAERNSRLLLASLAGVKAASDQVERIETSRRELRTYTAAGTAGSRPAGKVTRDQRA
ncbi:MAG TPA: hypothetical protein PKA33_13895 [Amaricoccus sp.]|uniref:hypothetical protein n=1 Tax=Amaricoccus sp. TaxID=1872485 RepID=UPI002B734D15|nr:hypothetical protein [Amaricoccus sp.]HMQ93642.1 hypothetical protein [Amaricoccus sp.]HMR53499.1 hypothetical protein [Amaricoccus sp.]HMR62206.1 hypothetical protein [Amaricoccus sp.]HMU00443.1 hypothetical protein [Amaricoccus sp.]